MNAMQIPNPQKRIAALEPLAVQEQNLMARIFQEQVAQSQREAAALENDIRANNVPYIKVQRAKDFEVEIQNDVVIRRLKPVGNMTTGASSRDTTRSNSTGSIWPIIRAEVAGGFSEVRRAEAETDDTRSHLTPGTRSRRSPPTPIRRRTPPSLSSRCRPTAGQ